MHVTEFEPHFNLLNLYISFALLSSQSNYSSFRKKNGGTTHANTHTMCFPLINTRGLDSLQPQRAKTPNGGLDERPPTRWLPDQ